MHYAHAPPKTAFILRKRMGSAYDSPNAVMVDKAKNLDGAAGGR